MDSHSQSQSGFFHNNSGGQNSTPRKEQKQNIRSVTIKQLKGASEPQPESGSVIDGNHVEKVKLVGKIAEVIDKSTYIIYKIEDGTGIYEVRKWNDNSNQLSQDVEMDDGQSGSDIVAVGSYVSVIGSIKVYNNSRSVTAHQVRPIIDFNEVIYHQLEALEQHLFFTNSNSSIKSKPEEESLFVDSGDNSKSLRDRILDLLHASGSADYFTISRIMEEIPGSEEFDVSNAIEGLVSAARVTEVDDGMYYAIG